MTDRNTYGGMNAGIEINSDDDRELWDIMLSSGGGTGLSDCCGGKVIIRIIDGTKLLECLACGKECDVTT